MFYLRHLSPAVIGLGMAALLAPHLSCAQEPPAETSPWFVGIGVARMQRPYIGLGNKAFAFPYVAYENKYVRISGLDADLKLWSAGPVSLVLRTKYAIGDGYRSGDSPTFDDMGSRRGSLWLGPSLKWNADLARVSLTVMGDALGRTDGVQARVGVEHDFRAGAFAVTPHAAAEFMDRKYVNFYYGVTAAESTASRPSYGGRSTVNFELGLRSAFAISQANTVLVDVGIKVLGKGVTDSVLTDRKVVPGMWLAYIHRL